MTPRTRSSVLPAVVAGLAFVGGVGAGAVVQASGVDVVAREVAVAAAVGDGDGDGAGAGAPAGRSAERGVAAGADASTGPQPVSVPVAAAADVRPVPVPRVVARDAVGPLWLTPADREAGVLALDVPASASGVLDVVPGGEPAPGTVGVRTVSVEVERGLAVDGAAFAATVMATLDDPRGWGARGDVSFARTDGPADLRVVLASPALVDALCAPLDTGGEVSCGRNGHAVLNHRRWVLATDEFVDRTLYRQYLVNHEVGHLLGHGHERCPGAGQLAPLMQQQSLRVAPCVPNGWPYPHG